MAPPTLGSIMGKLTGTAKRPTDPAAGLTADDREDLVGLERVVETGVNAMQAVEAAGRALAEIQRRQLYRDRFDSFEGYVSIRWAMSVRRARQLVAFAGIADEIADVSREMGTAVPNVSEKATRPLTGLPPADRRDAIREAAASPEGVTAGSISRAAAGRRKGRRALPKPVRVRVPGGIVTVTLNRTGVNAGATVAQLLADAVSKVMASRSDAA